jgi:predicted ribosome quality control (RQC) complex YloA/Tae2 family protein
MIQSYLTLKKQVLKINSFLSDSSFIQKFYSTAHYIAFSIRLKGKTEYLFLGRGSGFEGIWLGDKFPKPFLRKKERFLEYLRRHLSAKQMISLSLDKDDRVISISYNRFNKLNHFCYFWCGRSSYFLHYYFDKDKDSFAILRSWRDKENTEELKLETIFEEFNQVGRKVIPKEKESQEISINELLKQEEDTAIKGSETKKKIKFLQRKRKNIESDLIRLEKWEFVENKISEEFSDLKLMENEKFEYEGVKVKFKSNWNEFKRRDEIFKKIKNLKKAKELLRARLLEVTSILSGKKESEKKNNLKVINPIWNTDKKKVTKVNESEFTVFDFEKYSVAIGKSALGNDQIRNSWASKEDYWFHIEDATSAHIVIKAKKEFELDESVISHIAYLMKTSTEFSDDWVPLIYTQVKNLRSVKGTKGKVRYSKEKHILAKAVDIDV